jgi:hypothetical protein
MTPSVTNIPGLHAITIFHHWLSLDMGVSAWVKVLLLDYRVSHTEQAAVDIKLSFPMR